MKESVNCNGQQFH